MPTDVKRAAVAEIKDKIDRAESVVFADYRGLSVADMQELRRNLRSAGIEFKVVKNTLTQLAVKDLEIEELMALLEGPTAAAFGAEDAIAPAKLLNDYARKSGILKLKGMLFEGSFYDADGTKALAILPSKEVLIAKLLGTMNAPITAFARVINAPIAAFARALQAVADKRVAEGEAAPAPAKAEVAEAAPEAQAAEAPVEALAEEAEAPEAAEAAELEATEAPPEEAPAEEAPAEEATAEAAEPAEAEEAPAEESEEKTD
jgi:large subunit ribosomal protein L10